MKSNEFVPDSATDIIDTFALINMGFMICKNNQTFVLGMHDGSVCLMRKGDPRALQFQICQRCPHPECQKRKFQPVKYQNAKKKGRLGNQLLIMTCIFVAKILHM